MNIAALVCYKPGERSRLIYRLHVYRGRKGEPKTFGWMDYRDLILHAHAQLGAPIVLVWDNLNLHQPDFVMSEPAFPVVASSGAGLVVSSVSGPGEGVTEGKGDRGGQACQQTADFCWCEADQAAWTFGACAAVTAR
ncbi:hypothetical protein [Microbispora hainanensis]|uniref:Tc1-like transposase DDE domain-containing protein n=1 Tax=Microbispora hainanensis TaxID=568844 RepID=A0ABZ1SUK2_9ACTN|nr:hypothetical protein [Microbispora hainanensis]